MREGCVKGENGGVRMGCYEGGVCLTGVVDVAFSTTGRNPSKYCPLRLLCVWAKANYTFQKMTSSDHENWHTAGDDAHEYEREKKSSRGGEGHVWVIFPIILHPYSN